MDIALNIWHALVASDPEPSQGTKLTVLVFLAIAVYFWFITRER